MFTTKHGDRNTKNKITALDIGTPTDMRRNIHVTKNPETGRLEGLPKSWAKFLNKLSMKKQNEDPEGAQTTAQFYTENEKPPEEPSSTSLEFKKEIEEEEEEECHNHGFHRIEDVK